MLKRIYTQNNGSNCEIKAIQIQDFRSSVKLNPKFYLPKGSISANLKFWFIKTVEILA